MTGWRSCKYSRSPQGIYHNQGRVQKNNVKREIKDVTQIRQRHSVVRPQICNTPRDTLHVRRWFVFQQWEAKCSRGVRSVCQCLLLSIIINLVCIFKSFIPNKKCFLLDFFLSGSMLSSVQTMRGILSPLETYLEFRAITGHMCVRCST